MNNIEWPVRLCPQTMDWTMESNNRDFTSSLSNAQQIVTYPGAFWSVSIQFEALFRSKLYDRELSVLNGKLNGMAGTVKVPRFTRRKNENVGNLFLNVPAQNQARNIQVRGFTSGILIAGDNITVNDQMFEILEDAQPSGGIANLVLNKPVRGGMPSGLRIEYNNPYCVMRREESQYTINERPIISTGTLNLREAF